MTTPTPTTVSLAGEAVTASAVSRTLGGVVLRFGKHGRTSAGRLKVDDPAALEWPEDLTRVKLTREHDRAASRGHLAGLTITDGMIRASFKVADGADGDAALTEAADHTRDGLSFDIVDAVIAGDTITSGRVIAVGQVGIPAYDDGRIDTVAAALNPGDPMSEQDRARFAELAAQNTRTPEEEAEYAALAAAAAAELTQAPAADAPAADAAPPVAASVAASVPSVPSGVPAPAAPARTQPRGSALRRMVSELTAALDPKRGNKSVAAISAALTDVIHSDHTDNIEAPAWSGELWSGLQYVPEWTDLFSTGDLTNWEGRGWRFTSKLEIQDYAGDKAPIPSDQVTTEDSTYEAARMAVGVDVDRKFYDFPNEGFVTALVEQVRESWAIQLDAKVRAYVLAQAVAATRTLSATRVSGDATLEAANGSFTSADVGATITGTGIPGSTTILSVTDSGTIEMSANASASGTSTVTIGAQAPTVLKAAARASMTLKRNRVGMASWIVVNDEDMFSLLDVNEAAVPVFLNLWGIDPADFRSSPDVPAGTVIAGVRQAAVVRTLPGSPIRVSAQHIANGGVDEGFFGYWAIEEHHTSGITTVKYKAAA